MSETFEVQEEGLIKYEKKALSRVNPLRKKLNALRETYKEEPDLNTTAGYKKYREAIAAFRTLKGETEKERKDVKAVLNRIATAVDDSYNGVWDDAEKEQKERDAKLKEFDAEKERVKKEKDEAEQKVLIERTALLTGMGATVVDGHMVLNGYSLKLDQIKSSPEQVWQDAILKSFKEQYDIVEAERAEEERKDQERQEQLRQEQEKFRLEQDRLQKEREAFQKQQEEFLRKQEELRLKQEAAEKMEREEREAAERKERDRIAEEKRLKNANEEKLWRGRLAELKDIVWDGLVAGYKEMVVATLEQLITLTDTEFDGIKNWHNSKVEEDKAEAAQKQHEKWLKEQNERRELEELKEKERLADMTDGEKWRNWKNELTKFQSEMPDFSTKRYGKMKAIALEKFSEIHLLKAAKISSN